MSGQRAGRPLRALGGALVLVVAALVGAASAPQRAEAIGRLPSCDLGEVYTVPRGYPDWSTTLVDRLLRVEATYVPPDLMRVSEMGIAGGGYIRGVAAADTRAMARAARAAGAPIGVWSGYRSYKQQTQLFNDYVSANGFDSAITYSQRPGHSEHQLGLGVDFMSAGGGNPLPGDWGKTPAGAWMRENSWKYGWVNSYPRGAGGSRWNDRTCFRYEPWHYRYLGREMAAKVHASGLTIREYLWSNHTMLDRNGTPIAPATSAPPSATTSASPAPGSSSEGPTTPPSATPSDRSVAVTGPVATAADGQSPAEDGSGGVGRPVLVAAGVGLLAVLGALAVAALRRRAR